MSVSSFSGPVLSTAGFQVGSEASPVTLVDSAGNFTTTAQVKSGSLLVTGEVDQVAVQGGANSLSRAIYGKAGIADTVATDIILVTVLNLASRAVMRLLVSSGLDGASHNYDSNRVVEYLCTITRVAGANVVAVLSAAIGAQIATSAGGRTLTSTLGVSAITGAVGATNTFTIQVTNTASAGAQTAETLIAAELMNGSNGSVIMSQAP